MKNKKNVTLIHSQKGKLLFWGSILSFAGIGFLFPENLSLLLPVDMFFIDITATFLSVIVLVGASLSIRCQYCGLRLFWYAISEKNLGAWLDWLLHVEECPRCKKSAD